MGVNSDCTLCFNTEKSEAKDVITSCTNIFCLAYGIQTQHKITVYAPIGWKWSIIASSVGLNLHVDKYVHDKFIIEVTM